MSWVASLIAPAAIDAAVEAGLTSQPITGAGDFGMIRAEVGASALAA